MRKIVLLCNGGLSTGILVKKMKEEADRTGYECSISASPVSDAEAVGADADIILLGPQVRFQMQTVKKQVSCPVISIEPVAYGTMNGQKALLQAKKELGDE